MDILENLNKHVDDYKKVKSNNFTINPKDVINTLHEFSQKDTLFNPEEIKLYLKTTILRIDVMLFNMDDLDEPETQMLKDLRSFITELYQTLLGFEQ